MTRRALPIAIALTLLPFASTGQAPAPIENPAIDMEGFLDTAREAARHRRSRRLSEADFVRMSREPGTVVLDARSRQKYGETSRFAATGTGTSLGPLVDIEKSKLDFEPTAGRS